VTDDEVDAMRCRTCPDPGVCCRSFVIGKGLHKDDLSLAFLHTWEYCDCSPASIVLHDAEYDEVRGTWFWRASCARVTPEGTCSIYDKRPRMCQVFKPILDYPCALHPDWENMKDNWISHYDNNI
jgi:Fe-S-cluster containining protein